MQYTPWQRPSCSHRAACENFVAYFYVKYYKVYISEVSISREFIAARIKEICESKRRVCKHCIWHVGLGFAHENNVDSSSSVHFKIQSRICFQWNCLFIQLKAKLNELVGVSLLNFFCVGSMFVSGYPMSISLTSLIIILRVDRPIFFCARHSLIKSYCTAYLHVLVV